MLHQEITAKVKYALKKKATHLKKRLRNNQSSKGYKAISDALYGDGDDGEARASESCQQGSEFGF